MPDRIPKDPDRNYSGTDYTLNAWQVGLTGPSYAVDGPPPHRDVPIRDNDGPTASYILAFAERQVLAEAVEELRQRPP